MNLWQIRCLAIKQRESQVSTLAYNPLLCLLPQDCLPLLAKKTQKFHRVPTFFWPVNLRLRIATEIALPYGPWPGAMNQNSPILRACRFPRCATMPSPKLLRRFAAWGSRSAARLGEVGTVWTVTIRSVECSRCLIVEPGLAGQQSPNKHSK